LPAGFWFTLGMMKLDRSYSQSDLGAAPAVRLPIFAAIIMIAVAAVWADAGGTIP